MSSLETKDERFGTKRTPNSKKALYNLERRFK
jgi:hypothetical protein